MDQWKDQEKLKPGEDQNISRIKEQEELSSSRTCEHPKKYKVVVARKYQKIRLQKVK